jgi:tetratricopeptide (TPR) repeat protein
LQIERYGFQMSDTARLQVTGAVAEAASARAALLPVRRRRLASVRVSPGGYLVTACGLTFIALLLMRAELDLPALLAFACAWLITPVLAFTDRISFDGHTLTRRGLMPYVQQLFRGRALVLQMDEVERVETSAVRTLRSGGRVRYRYRSEVTGRGVSFVFVSGGESYRRMVRVLFPLLSDEKLDARSGELRDYLASPQTLSITLNYLRLASVDVLDNASEEFPGRAGSGVRHQRTLKELRRATDFERGRLLRRAANELRAAGRLREAAEAFRRALLVTPRDPWLVYEFARFMRSQASANSDARLLARARAALRLAARRGSDNASLLGRIGESFFEFGDVDAAARHFRRALELNPQAFRAEIGLAELALRNGKLAHVIHNYDAAARIAPEDALSRFARRESDYYARLNDDDDYLSAELRRINWLQHLHQARRISVRLQIAGILFALVGPSIDPALESLGWSLATSAVIAWVVVASLSRFLTHRSKAQTSE